MNKRLQELAEGFPSTPHRTLLKTDVLREGIRFTPVLRVGLERRRLIKQSALWTECIDIWK